MLLQQDACSSTDAREKPLRRQTADSSPATRRGEHTTARLVSHGGQGVDAATSTVRTRLLHHCDSLPLGSVSAVQAGGGTRPLLWAVAVEFLWFSLWFPSFSLALLSLCVAVLCCALFDCGPTDLLCPTSLPVLNAMTKPSVTDTAAVSQMFGPVGQHNGIEVWRIEKLKRQSRATQHCDGEQLQTEKRSRAAENDEPRME